jgi:hypothetical protein
MLKTPTLFLSGFGIFLDLPYTTFMIKKPLPIGTQHFESLRQNGAVYVDKTMFLFDMITTGRVYFLSRPRRFGKSLTVTTLEAIFKGKKELFEDLFIAQTDYDWHPYPIIRIDMSSLVLESTESFAKGLSKTLTETASFYGLQLIDAHPKDQLEWLIKSLATQSPSRKVVVLIDEYDKPIIEHITNIPIATKIRDSLKSFYGILKPMDEFLKFVFITGVSKFSKTSIFSDLNHLDDLTLHPEYGALCGYTQTELEANFDAYLNKSMVNTNLSREALLDKIKLWYNGYRFNEHSESVYNPFSTLKFFGSSQFKPHWFETGSPTFLLNLIEHKHFQIEKAENFEADETFMSDYNLEDLQIIPLLFQTGYLTIGGYNDTRRQYILTYPNYEVKDAFFTVLFNHLSHLENNQASHYLWQFVDALQAGNINAFFESLKTFFAQIPYDIHIKQERYYQSLFYLIFTLIGCKITAEVRTNKGRIDAVIETQTDIYIFEFKIESEKTSQQELDALAHLALHQIETMGYAEKYANALKPVHKMGVAFDVKARNVGAVVVG